MKRLIMFLLICAFLFVPVSSSYASMFHPTFVEFNNNGETRYKYLDGHGEVKNRWIQNSTGNWYYAGSDGYLLKDAWFYYSNDEKWYYFGDEWAMLHDTTTPDGYYVDSDGAWDGGEKEDITDKPKSPDEAIKQKSK